MWKRFDEVLDALFRSNEADEEDADHVALAGILAQGDLRFENGRGDDVVALMSLHTRVEFLSEA